MMDYTPNQVAKIKAFMRLDKKFQVAKAELNAVELAREDALSDLDGEFGFDNVYHELKKAQRYFDEFPEELSK